MDFNFYMPVRVLGGRNAVTQHPEIFTQFGKKCLLVTGGSSAKASGALDDVQTVLSQNGIEATVFDEVKPNPTAADCHRAGQLARDFEVEFIVGIGGGSALDSAKAIAVYAANKTLSSEGIYAYDYMFEPLPLVLVGTTAGTGSEVTGVSVLTRENGRKQSVSGKDFYAKVAFADPKYTYSVPYAVTVSTALDAFAHAVEGWFSNRFDDMARLFGEKAIPVLWKHLKVFYETGELPCNDARDELYYASLYAGMELNICGAGFPHGMGYALTEDFALPHGRACAAFMPSYVKRGMEFKNALAMEFFSMLGTNFPEFEKIILTLTDLSGISMTEEQIESYCARWQNLKNFKNSPGGYNVTEAGQVLRELFLK